MYLLPADQKSYTNQPYCSNFIEDAYSDDHFVQVLSNSLSPTGIFAAQVGEAPEVNSPPEEFSHFKYRHRLLQNLLKVDFEEIRDYEEVCIDTYLKILALIVRLESHIWLFRPTWVKVGKRSSWLLSKILRLAKIGFEAKLPSI